MQIVIDIPKEIVEWVNKYSDYIKIFTDKKNGIIVDAVKNGTPLPKGHGRLIDADTLQKTYCDDNCGNRKCVDAMDRCIFIDAVLNAPTIIEADKAESEE